MRTYSRLFDAEIRKSGAKTILFLTWANWDKQEMQSVVNETYYSIAKELNAVVAPVGPAWEVARRLSPNISLYNGDEYSHPTPAGSYLAACVIYIVITNQPACPAIEPRFDIQPDEIAVVRSAAVKVTTDFR
jgi:hypothetical protein